MFTTKSRSRAARPKLRALADAELACATGGTATLEAATPGFANSDRGFVPGNVRGQPAVNTPAIP